MKKFAPLFLVPFLFLCGCSIQQDAQKAQQVIGAILSVAQAEEADLPPADAAILTPWVNLGLSLNGQLATCDTAAGSSKSKVLTCFNAFAGGLLAPAELAQLRVISSGSQGKAQLWITAIISGVNVAVIAAGASPVTAPAVGPAPTSAQLDQLRAQIGM